MQDKVSDAVHLLQWMDNELYSKVITWVEQAAESGLNLQFVGEYDTLNALCGFEPEIRAALIQLVDHRRKESGLLVSRNTDEKKAVEETGKRKSYNEYMKKYRLRLRLVARLEQCRLGRALSDAEVKAIEATYREVWNDETEKLVAQEHTRTKAPVPKDVADAIRREYMDASIEQLDREVRAAKQAIAAKPKRIVVSAPKDTSIMQAIMKAKDKSKVS
jgi:hypothetical protein